MTDQEIHDIKKVREFIEHVNETLTVKQPIEAADIRGMQYMLRDASERCARTLRDTEQPKRCPTTAETLTANTSSKSLDCNARPMSLR